MGAFHSVEALYSSFWKRYLDFVLSPERVALWIQSGKIYLLLPVVRLPGYVL